MSHGPMVSAASLLRVKRELETVYWILALFLAAQAKPQPRACPERAKRAEGRPMFDYKMRQAGERDE